MSNVLSNADARELIRLCQAGRLHMVREQSGYEPWRCPECASSEVDATMTAFNGAYSRCSHVWHCDRRDPHSRVTVFVRRRATDAKCDGPACYSCRVIAGHSMMNAVPRPGSLSARILPPLRQTSP
jgi:hypothetical protein